MSADLTVYTADPAALDHLGEHGITALMERAKSWLDLAKERGAEVDELVQFKGEAAVLRELIVQKELGKDAELSAAELVRRAEIGLALAVRLGQQRGEIAGREAATAARLSHQNPDAISVKPRAIDFFTSHTERTDAYAMADAPAEVREAAIAEAKAEGNLSRANVVRKVTGRQKPKGKRPEVLRGTHRIDSHRVIAATVDTAAANTLSKDLLAEIDLSELDTHDLEEWISSLSESIRALTSLKTTLKKELSQRG